MKAFKWDDRKNISFRKERGVSFEDVLYCINNGNIVDIIDHPNKEKYSHQRLFIIEISDYIYYVPFVETESEIFLKSIIPSRKYTKRYTGGKQDE